MLPIQRLTWIRVRIFFRQCRIGLLVALVWFTFGTIAFHFFLGESLGNAILEALFLKFSNTDFWWIYSFWSQFILFGVVVSIFILQAFQRYDPQEVCRMLAREMKDHAVIVGYTHLGSRVVEHFRENRLPYVLIDLDAKAVDHLVRAGEPVIVDDAKQESTLTDASVAEATLVLIASNNIETALLVTKRAREKNPKARIIVRCYQDEFAEILESLGASEVISSSKSAFREVETHLAAAL